ncbi:MAG TPA: DUF962 domain-containing protein [Terriglobia bacterium]
MVSKQYRTFASFYPYYLSEHRNPTCRRLHFGGSVLIAAALGYVLVTQSWLGLLALPVLGYGFGWIGHAFFEKNVPTTSTYPFYSFCAYWVMVKDIAIGRLKF